MTKPPVETPDGRIYEVFARQKKSSPLQHIGSVTASEENLAKMYAYKLYDEWSWQDMFIVDRASITTLVEIQ